MEFTLNEEQEMLKKSARDFLKNECDKKVLKELEASDSGFSRELWSAMAELGWMGITIPESYGGVGLGLIELAVLFEEYGRAALNGPMLTTAVGAWAILEGGTEAQKQGVLPEVCAGKRVLAFGLDEPEVASDPRFVATRAVSEDGGIRISGTKLFIPYANVADELVVVARNRGEPGDASGLGMYLVPARAEGIHLSGLKTIAGDRQFQVDLEGVLVRPEERIGGEEGREPSLDGLLEKARAVVCAEMVGGAQYELEITAEYCRTRVQFDRPIGTFQAVQHRLADMYMDVLGARLTTYQAVWRLSEGLDASREVAIAKAFTSQAARRVALSAQQLHGGMGYDLDHELHFYYRRAKALELRLGTTSAQLSALRFELGM